MSHFQFFYDVGPESTFASQEFTTTGGDALVNSVSPGLAYDPVSEQIVGWNGGDTVYFLDIETKSWQAAPYVGGPGNAAPNGTFKRWSYAPQLNVFVVVNSIDRDAFVLRLSPDPQLAAPGALQILQ